jgi:hypothetical protein
LTKNIKFEWKQEHEKAFQDIKKVISSDVLLTYPDHSKPFDIHMDSSNYQIGSEISQQNKPIAYLSKQIK